MTRSFVFLIMQVTGGQSSFTNGDSWRIISGTRTSSTLGDSNRLSNLVDGSNTCDLNTCATGIHSCYWVSSTPSTGAFLEVQMLSPHYVTYLALDPKYRGDSRFAARLCSVQRTLFAIGHGNH